MIRIIDENKPETLKYFNYVLRKLGKIHINYCAISNVNYYRRKHKILANTNYILHHIDGNENNNKENNKAYVTTRIHQRLHSRYEWRVVEVTFFKRCAACGKFKAIENYSQKLTGRGSYIKGRCKQCRAKEWIKENYAKKNLSARTVSKAEMVQRA